MRFNTLLLDQSQWDLVLDASGNIAMAQPPYAVAQDVASALRTFKGEVYYNTDMGVPYFEDVLGQLPPVSFLSNLIEKEALTVSGVVKSQLVINSSANRTINAQLQFIDEVGELNNVQF